MSEIDKDDNLIYCSRCHVKYHNTSESISKYFGYKRLGERYKLCIKCRASTDIKECCVCMKRLNKNNSVQIKCNHNICINCVDRIRDMNGKYPIFKCPLCRKEYSGFGYYNPIICKVVFKNEIEAGLTNASDVFYYSDRYNFKFDSLSEKFIINDIWLKKMKILFKILYQHMNSGTMTKPFVLYMCKDGVNSFTLKANKPKDDEELIDESYFENYLQQDDWIVLRFLYESVDIKSWIEEINTSTQIINF